MSLLIRPTQPEDAPTVVAMVTALSEHDQETGLVFDEEAFRRHGFGSEADFTALLAELDGEVVGFAAFTRAFVFEWAVRGAYLLQLWVEEPARGQGVGEALLRAVCREGKARGAEFLAWNTASVNKGAEAFYRKLGAETHDILSWSATGELFEKLAADES